MKIGYAKMDVEGKVTKNNPYKVLDETDKEYQIQTDAGDKMFFPKQLFSGKQRSDIDQESSDKRREARKYGALTFNPPYFKTGLPKYEEVAFDNYWKGYADRLTSNITPTVGPNIKFPDDYSKSIDAFMNNLSSIEKYFKESETKKDIKSLRDCIEVSMAKSTCEYAAKDTTEDSDCTNDGGKTDYYQLKKDWIQAQDIIEDRDMNFSQGNIFKAAFTFNVGRHDGTDYRRELKKIIFFANRELERLKNGKN